MQIKLTLVDIFTPSLTMTFHLMESFFWWCDLWKSRRQSTGPSAIFVQLPGRTAASASSSSAGTPDGSRGDGGIVGEIGCQSKKRNSFQIFWKDLKREVWFVRKKRRNYTGNPHTCGLSFESDTLGLFSWIFQYFHGVYPGEGHSLCLRWS